jgi:hypothetical protein
VGSGRRPVTRWVLLSLGLRHGAGWVRVRVSGSGLSGEGSMAGGLLRSIWRRIEGGEAVRAPPSGRRMRTGGGERLPQLVNGGVEGGLWEARPAAGTAAGPGAGLKD